MSIEEAQLIFKLRCQVTNIKQIRGKYGELECRACRPEEENQKHITQECKILNKETEKIEYETLFNETVNEKIRIARKFQKNYEILVEENDWKLKDRELDNFIAQMGPCDWIIIHVCCSIVYRIGYILYYIIRPLGCLMNQLIRR